MTGRLKATCCITARSAVRPLANILLYSTLHQSYGRWLHLQRPASRYSFVIDLDITPILLVWHRPWHCSNTVSFTLLVCHKPFHYSNTASFIGPFAIALDITQTPPASSARLPLTKTLLKPASSARLPWTLTLFKHCQLHLLVCHRHFHYLNLEITPILPASLLVLS